MTHLGLSCRSFAITQAEQKLKTNRKRNGLVGIRMIRQNTYSETYSTSSSFHTRVLLEPLSSTVAPLRGWAV